MINITINKKVFEANDNETILDTCKRNNIYIPTLCYHPDLKKEAKCRICIVEANGKIVTSCNTFVQKDMIIITENEKINEHRKTLLELMMGNDPKLLEEAENELVDIAKKLKISKTPFKKLIDKPSRGYGGVLHVDNNKCIMCGKCVQKCQITQEVFAICYDKRGVNTLVTPYLQKKLDDTVCIFCGQCSLSCPTGAIKEKDYTEEVFKAIKDPTKHVIVQSAPSIRATIGETQGMPVGSKVTGKLVTALKQMGFDKVVDTNFAADLTIIEEGTELIDRIQNKKPLPLFTSCSPGWVLFMEHFYPELIPNVSSCKSPQQMMGTMIKTYYAKKNNINPKDIVSVSIMPCTAKKFEAQRPEMNTSGYQDVDYVLTTREAGRMIKKAKIDFKNLKDSDFDPLLGESTGAAVIFAATGGVMEAALRFAAEVLENKKLEKIDFTEVRGLAGIKEASLTIAGIELNVAVAHGGSNAHKIIKLVKENPSKYHFIEIMACPGGCIGGGGQPLSTSKNIIQKRTAAIYDIDKNLSYRKSQDNPEIKQIYQDFLGKPGGHKAHELLHTYYIKRNKV